MKIDPKNWRGMAGRLAAEFAIVVLGVTIALWADSWVTERSDREEEVARLEALAINVDATLANLEANLENVAGGIEVLRILSSPAEHPMSDGEWLDVLRYGLLFGPDFAPELNVYDDLKSSGELALISNSTVRQLLARMDAQLERTRVAQEDLSTVQVSIVDRYVVDNLDLMPVYGGSLGLNVPDGEISMESDFRSDLQLRNRALLKLDVVTFLQETYESLRDRLLDVNAAVNAQLENDR